MNRLPVQDRAQILTMLCEGNSMRSTSRVTGVSINTVAKLLVDAGLSCAAFHDDEVRNVSALRVQCDEIWSFSHAKRKNATSSAAALELPEHIWTWTGLDVGSKLIVSWHVGDRSLYTGIAFINDLKARLANRVQLTRDGRKAYLKAVTEVDSDADHAMLNKIFATDDAGPGRYNRPKRSGSIDEAVSSNPGPRQISSSFAAGPDQARRRFTCLTYPFSKKFENHCHALALYFFHYNFCRVHETLGATPATTSGLMDRIMKMENLIEIMDAPRRS